MSYQEKRTLTMLFTGIAVMAAYCLYAFNPSRLGSLPAGDLKSWAVSMLIFIGIGVVASIIIQIVFHILIAISMAIQAKLRDENSDDKLIENSIGAEMVEDEMDKLIELKSNRYGFFVAGAGFIAALVALLANASPVVMLNILFLSFNVGSICEGVAQLVYYRKGV